MKYIFFSILFSIILSGCIESKKGSKTKDEVKVSPQTKIFIQELNRELVTNHENFQPSEVLIENYNLQKTGSDYYIGCILSVEENFHEEEIFSLGVNIGTKAGHIWTVMIPILKLEELLLLPGIKNVQIDEDVKLKNN